MANRIGDTAALAIELTTIRGVLMVVLKELGSDEAEHRVMFPVNQLAQIQSQITDYLAAAFVQDSLKHDAAPDIWTDAIDGVPYLWTNRKDANIAAHLLQKQGIEANVMWIDTNAYAIADNSKTKYIEQEAATKLKIAF